jgi:O-antigen ligase
MDRRGKIVLVLNKLLLANLCIFILLCPFFKRIPKITAVVSFVLWLAVNLIKYKKHFYKYLVPKTNLAKPLLFFIAALIFSVIFSLDPYHSQSILFERYLYYFFFFIIGSYLGQNKKNLFFLTAAIILTSIVVGVGGVWDLIRFSPRRLFTFYGNEVILTSFLALFIPFSFTLAVFLKNKTLQISAAVSFLLLLPIFLFNASRSVWGAVLFTILVISFLNSKKLAVSLLIIILIIGVFLLPDYFQKRVATTFNPDRWGDRVAMWESAVNISKDFPVFGAGLGTYKKFLYKYNSPGAYKKQGHLHAHSSYLELLAEAGIVGLAAFLALFAIYFRNFFRFYKKALDDRIRIINLGFAGSILAILIVGFSGSVMVVGIQGANLFWFFFGLAAGLINENKINNSVKEEQR